MKCFRVVAAALAAVTLFSCDPTREKPDPVQIRVQNLTPYDVFLRDAPDKSRDSLVLVRSVDALESSIRLFRYLPAQTVDRLVFYPYFLLPVLTVMPPVADSMVTYYEEYFEPEIYLTVPLSVNKREYTTDLNRAPYGTVYRKAYIAVENAGTASCEVFRGNTLCTKSDFLVRGIGSVSERTVAKGETAVYAFDPLPVGFELNFRFLSGVPGGNPTADIPAMIAGQIVRVRLLLDGGVEVSEAGELGG